MPRPHQQKRGCPRHLAEDTQHTEAGLVSKGAVQKESGYTDDCLLVCWPCAQPPSCHQMGQQGSLGSVQTIRMPREKRVQPGLQSPQHTSHPRSPCSPGCALRLGCGTHKLVALAGTEPLAGHQLPNKHELPVMPLGLSRSSSHSGFLVLSVLVLELTPADPQLCPSAVWYGQGLPREPPRVQGHRLRPCAQPHCGCAWGGTALTSSHT